MLVLIRRFLVIAALMFWSGGFVFYAAVVVPIGTDVLRTALDQGFITRQVAKRINWAGIGALAIFAWDAFTYDVRWRRGLRLAMILIALVCLGMLFWLHPRMAALMPSDFGGVLDDPFRFDRMHQAYLWIITVQWAASVAFMGLSLMAWREEDRANALTANS
jgi:hypothetical protein